MNKNGVSSDAPFFVAYPLIKQKPPVFQ